MYWQIEKLYLLWKFHLYPSIIALLTSFCNFQSNSSLRFFISSLRFLLSIIALLRSFWRDIILSRFQWSLRASAKRVTTAKTTAPISHTRRLCVFPSDFLRSSTVANDLALSLGFVVRNLSSRLKISLTFFILCIFSFNVFSFCCPLAFPLSFIFVNSLLPLPICVTQ